MASGPQSTSRSKSVHKSTLEQVDLFLRELPNKEKDHLSLREAITEMAESVRTAMAKGYSYSEIAALLSEHMGISVSSWSLRRYIAVESRRDSPTKQADAKTGVAPRRQRRARTEPARKEDESSGVQVVQAVSASTAIVEAPPTFRVDAPLPAPGSPPAKIRSPRSRSTPTQPRSDSTPSSKQATQRKSRTDQS
ncbi:hypothetical protein BST81_02090 [Leptolyngbya sp. 'hensonii']|uniref:hypothetical protein n=1 Tax=Leptolyngbya sp. 'hensonii' TaxID=1922337 RepID=UPI00094F93F5|nr:hypothetical protein [Leptolyngbya sp. 'hensonii']OLP20051.1 hypothetical protein BST81_02090 [Leptolyngbya sp. 'hensonii']